MNPFYKEDINHHYKSLTEFLYVILYHFLNALGFDSSSLQLI